MAPYREIFVHRSDGKLQVQAKGKTPELNGPTKEQLDETPGDNGVKDYYKEVLPGAAKELEWRRKLGGMLHRALATPEQKDQLWVLARMPDNYRLFEHLKLNPNDVGDQAKGGRKNAHRGSDRQDAYMYGHPAGRKKRYRCPADFFNHLLWLATDEEGDPDNCTCMICNPEEMPKDSAKAAATQSPAPGPTQPSTDSSQANFKVVPPPIPSAQLDPAQNFKVVPPPVPPASQPQVQSSEQELDMQLKAPIYRLGEIVWFCRGLGWGLAVVQKRSLYNSSQMLPQPRYLIQPLSHPYNSPVRTVVGDESQLRPWLAWSAPPLKIPSLKNKAYDDVDWNAIVRSELPQNSTQVEVDSSILGARRVDQSYTLFGQLSVHGTEPGSTAWNGMFLGGEKVWTHEALRLRSVDERQIEILVLKTILEFPQGITLIGDRYAFGLRTSGHQQVDESLAELPLRVRKDLEYRNSFVQPGLGYFGFWSLRERGSRVGLNDVTGRWYESRVLLPLLQDSEQLAQSQQQGQVNDVNQFINARGTAMSNATLGIRYETREAAFGRSVPIGFALIASMDATDEPDTQMDGFSSSAVGGQVPPAGNNSVGGEDVNQFMNLDG